MQLADSVQNLLDRATRLADGQAIKTIRATLGELTGLTPAEVQAEFKRRRRATSAAAAELILRLEPGRVVCLSCEQPVPVHVEGQSCEQCGSYRRQVVAGHLLAVEGVSVDRSRAATQKTTAARRTARRATLDRLQAQGGWDE